MASNLTCINMNISGDPRINVEEQCTFPSFPQGEGIHKIRKYKSDLKKCRITDIPRPGSTQL